MKSTTAISRRLIIYLGISLPALWLLTALFSAISVFHEINEAGDTQMSQLARSLLAVPIDSRDSSKLNPLPSLHLSKQQRGLIDADEMGFIVWSAQGQILLADTVGQHLPYQHQFQGFINYGQWWQKKAWRAFYVYNAHTKGSVAVAASRRERLKTVRSAIWIQLGVSILSLPLLLWLIVWGVKRGTAPLNRLATELNARDAASLVPINDQAPKEIQPVVEALNALFQRVDETLKREQRFTADAAHELRSPLAALKIQTEVLALEGIANDAQQTRLQLIQSTLDRTTHLVNQLLILSRLDPLVAPQYQQLLNWQKISDEALQSVSLLAREKQVRLHREVVVDWSAVLPLYGDDLLLVILLRNLLDNAIRYSPNGGLVTIQLSSDFIMVDNQGEGVAENHLQRLHERFFRPAGQTEAGSGLGLSIVDAIANLHGISIEFQNKKDVQGQTVGFSVILEKIKYYAH